MSSDKAGTEGSKRPSPYTGPTETNDFDDLNADQMSELVASYKLLGECFEDASSDDMLGRGFLIDTPLDLLKDKYGRAEQTRRELRAAVRLARFKGLGWRDIGAAMGMAEKEAMEEFSDRPTT
uniref:Uncharacterized protein n=1 Tax=Arthrobacter sp. J3.40 TaxID=347209 RepID=I3W108_9MICC|nr:hypothetical protein [Arthrobacter sp. J3.40]AFK89285.1 hypothetical protein [Arthrobacter sp. J3.40]